MLLKARKQSKLARKAEEAYILERCKSVPAGWKGALFDILTLPSQGFCEALSQRERPRGVEARVFREATDELALARFAEVFPELAAELADFQKIIILRGLGVLSANKRYRNQL